MRFGKSSSLPPYILGALLDAAAHGYRCCRASASSGCRAWLTSRSGPQPARAHFDPRGTLETAYSNNRRAAIENIIDADPVAAHVREIMADSAQWTGSALDLLQVGTSRAGAPILAERSQNGQCFQT
jgi:hypothetical protein